MRTLARLSLLLGVATLAAPVHASTLPIDITAQLMRSDPANCVVTYSGGAILTRGDKELQAEVIEVHMAKQDGACGVALRAEARGEVRARSGSHSVSGHEEAVFDFRADSIDLRGGTVTVSASSR